MPQQKPFNLFMYGTLMNPSVFRAVLGRRMVFSPGDADGVEAFHVRDAVLDGWKKISPDHTYLYAVPDTFGRIRGYVVGPLPPECMKSLLRYEGRNYSRRTVAVQTKEGMQKAVLFVANVKQLEHAFGYEFHDPFKQEVLLRGKIEAALLEAQREQLNTDSDDSITRRAIGELHGDTIRDLIRTHFDAGGVSDYAIRHSIKDAPLRNFDRVRNDPEAIALAPNYLSMVVRQVIFNQFEEHIRHDFRYELDHMSQGPSFYDRTISALAALSLLNAGEKFLHLLVGDCLTDLKFPQNHLIDFVKWAIVAADAIYSPKMVKRRLMEIRTHMAPGEIPLGTELEFSNIGHGVIRDPEGKQARDLKYDGLLYFSDFALDILTWRLGGHIDDHRDKASTRQRRGFFEIALGNLSIGENISKPITNDPWVLNQIIHEARKFYDIAPHSMHISMQLRSGHRQMPDRTLPLGVLKCLFALGGDAKIDDTGRLRIGRLVGEEIIGQDPNPHMLFSDIRKRYSRNEESQGVSRRPTGRYVQQFRFLRLSPDINYEPVIMGLKGIQLALSPGNFLTSSQWEKSPKHRRLYEDLMAWGIAPTPIPREEIESFLAHVQDGLMTEHRHKPAHNPAYIAWAVNHLRQMLGTFNSMAAQRKKGSCRPEGAIGT